MAHQVVWEKMALQNEDGSDTILKRGQTLPDGVTEFTLGVLTSIGAVRFMEDAPSQEEQDAMAAELSTEDPDPSVPPAGLPSTYPSNQTGDPAASTDPEPPSTSANKPEWVEYAVSRGMDRTAAERLSKDALINRYGK